MSDLDGSVGVSEPENVWREIWGERESKGREKGVKEREREHFSLHLVDMWCVCGTRTNTSKCLTPLIVICSNQHA